MERSYTFADKSGWGDGPWQHEPDKVQWVDEASGLDCLAVRNARMGHWCGYVGVAEGHRFFEVGYDDCPDDCGKEWCEHRPESALDVHGGITYSEFCQEGAEETGICHRPFEDRSERIWWLGFDMAHAGDLSPSMNQFHLERYGHPRHDLYRPLDYVRTECAQLAGQLATMGEPA